MGDPALSTAVVVPFPLDERSALVRQTAVLLLSLNRKEATAEWKRLVEDVRGDLVAIGLADWQQEAQLRRFHSAVDQAMRNLTARPYGTPGGEAA